SASVMRGSASGILGTVEVGNGFPRDGTDGEWKIAGRDAILTMKDGIMKLATAEGDETLAGSNVTAPYFTVLRDALDHWQRGAAPLRASSARSRQYFGSLIGTLAIGSAPRTDHGDDRGLGSPPRSGLSPPKRVLD